VVEDSIILGNAGGFNMLGAGGVMNTAFVQNTVLDANTSYATQVGGSNILVISGSTLTGSPFSISTTVARSGRTGTTFSATRVRRHRRWSCSKQRPTRASRS
jgi:hypothetical protein